ncbi:MAG: response regulator [Patescibacteria group bacterium]
MADQPRILIIDDEREFIEIFGAKLSAAGFRIESALSGAKGIEMAKIFKPDLILLDVKMPGLTGAETLLILKEDPQTKDVNVVFLTNLGDQRTKAQLQDVGTKFSKEFGARGYLRKTDDLESIVEQVKSFLPKAGVNISPHSPESENTGSSQTP